MDNLLQIDPQKWLIELQKLTNSSAQIATVYHATGITVVMSAFVGLRLYKVEHVFSTAELVACRSPVDLVDLTLATVAQSLAKQIWADHSPMNTMHVEVANGYS